MKQQQHVRGITLIELMVAMALGVVLMAGVIQVFIGSNQTFGVVQAQTHMQENGRFAMDFMSRVVRHAGYDDDISFNAITNPELRASRWPGGNGFNATAVIAGTNNAPLITGAKAASDTVSLRYRGAEDDTMRDCQGVDVPAGAMLETTFFVSDANELRCTSAGDVATTTATLVEGIDEMHITYGVNTDLSEPGQANLYVTADDVPDWSRVVAIKIALLASSTSEALQDTSVVDYDFSDVGEGNLTYEDGRARQRFVQTIGLRNRLL